LYNFAVHTAHFFPSCFAQNGAFLGIILTVIIRSGSPKKASSRASPDFFDPGEFAFVRGIAKKSKNKKYA